ncbi:hypothetical protein LMG27174_07296 [Paraburkholderia rhynchosiae]|uniref:Uncharacterized protein n=1 Tax=Paraburkholderia rhynchosiae TaxID=487049 RepID=A0A6J5CUS4_9BURK|nr:hypothetical protein LMG27174_07296 [Paraburkholderia rhynchosiae]
MLRKGCRRQVECGRRIHQARAVDVRGRAGPLRNLMDALHMCEWQYSAAGIVV